MDMMLPIMTGLAATEFIMAHCPTPILVVSASTNRGELFRTYEALAAGAVDVLEKPRGDEAHGVWERSFIDAVRLVSRIHVITHPRARLTGLSQRPPHPRRRGRTCASGRPARWSRSARRPAARPPWSPCCRPLQPKFRIPVLLVLHIAEAFAAALADWLGGHRPPGGVRARGRPGGRAGRTGDPGPTRPPHGCARRPLVLNGEPERHSCRPSVDVLFESIARDYGPAAAACLLTGMGRDGASGLLDIRAAGGSPSRRTRRAAWCTACRARPR